jgi:hypothetical protein
MENYVTIELPSKNKVYSGVAGPIQIRTFKGKDEKIIAEITAENFEKRIVTVLKGVLQGIDPIKLTLGDRLFLILWETINSYGKDFMVSYECPKCWETKDYNVDLSKIEIQNLPDDFVEPFEVQLPVSKTIAKLRLLRVEDLLKIDELTKAKKNVWLYRYALTLVNDQNVWDNMEYLENMDSADIKVIRAFQDKHIHGPKLEAPFECQNCGATGIMPVPFRLEMLLPYGKNLN